MLKKAKNSLGVLKTTPPVANRWSEHPWLIGLIATLGSNLDSESKLCSEEPEWVLKSLLTNPPAHPAPGFFLGVKAPLGLAHVKKR